jgi:alpha-1,6-mannosyltransferase
MAADAGTPAGNRPLLPLRFGLDPAFVPQPSVERGDHVLYAGRLSREKGIFDLLRAAAASREPWPIRIVGTGPARGAVEAAIRRNGLRRRVTIGPYVADRAELAREYARAACVVMPGRFETFGLVALEAAASGAGVVAAAGVPAAAACGELCETFEPDDADGLLRAIERARARTPDLLAAARIGAAHDWRRAIEAETEELRGLLR